VSRDEVCAMQISMMVSRPMATGHKSIDPILSQRH